jgi:hypothetical protein
MASRLLAIATVAVVALLLAPFGAAAQFTVSTPLVIGVDHADLANQQPDQHRIFEYTDFFSRSVSVHTGDFIDFRAAPGSFHIVALAANETVARKVYPVAYAETVDPKPATGSGVAKLAFGPSNFPITGGSTHGGGTITFTSGFGPPVCGVQALGQQPCTFKGGDDIEVIGPTPGVAGAVFSDPPAQPTFVDQKMQINAPPGTYTYFCYIHPKMSGTLTVVDASQPATTQAQVDAASQTQFAADQAAGLAAEQAANVVKFTGGAPGTRTY